MPERYEVGQGLVIALKDLQDVAEMLALPIMFC